MLNSVFLLFSNDLFALPNQLFQYRFGQKTCNHICQNICCQGKNCKFIEILQDILGSSLLSQITTQGTIFTFGGSRRYIFVVFTGAPKASSKYLHGTLSFSLLYQIIQSRQERSIKYRFMLLLQRLQVVLQSNLYYSHSECKNYRSNVCCPKSRLHCMFPSVSVSFHLSFYFEV